MAEVVVAGAGIGGVCAAVAAARAGAKVTLLEAAAEIGGTGVHSPLSLVCTFADASGRVINDGLHREFFPQAYGLGKDDIPCYDEGDLKSRYSSALCEAGVEVRTNCAVTQVQREGRRIAGVSVSDGKRVDAKVFVDSTADGNLAALAGAAFQLGRDGDGAMQPATLTVRADGVEFGKFEHPPKSGRIVTWADYGIVVWQLDTLYKAANARGETSNPRSGILPFPIPGRNSIIFNATRIGQVDPTDPASLQKGMEQGLKQAEELIAILRQHPAFATATFTISKKLGVREGRRVLGDYVLTAEDCLGEARFEDMVAACGYCIDIHDPTGGAGARIEKIPGSGYYHIPYRCLVARDLDNLLLGSRCMSGTHEAHSSYRVMSSLSAIGQAAGVAAALAVRDHGLVRQIAAGEIRKVLRSQEQFVDDLA